MTREQVWRALSRASFAVVGYVTPGGQPRSSGVVYKVVGGRLYFAVVPDSWKARHIATTGTVSMTVMIRRPACQERGPRSGGWPGSFHPSDGTRPRSSKRFRRAPS